MGAPPQALLPPPGQPSDSPPLPGSVIDTAANQVSFGFENVSPPSPLYIQRDDVLVLQVASSLATEQVIFNIRLLLAPFEQGGQPSDASPNKVTGALITQGQIQSIQQAVGGKANQQVNSVVLALSEGYLLSVGAIANAASERGQTFAHAILVRGNAPTFSYAPYAVLFADYVSALNPAGWPYGRAIYPSEGPGGMKVYTVPNPAAGVDWNLSIPNNTRWKIRGIRTTLATSATVANRTPTLRVFGDSLHQVFTSGNNNAQTASTTLSYSYGPGVTPAQVSPTEFVAGLPEELTLATSPTSGAPIITSNTVGIQAADQWSSIQVMVEEWLDSV